MDLWPLLPGRSDEWGYSFLLGEILTPFISHFAVDPLPGPCVFLAFDHLGNIHRLEACSVCDGFPGQEPSDHVCVVFSYLLLDGEEEGFISSATLDVALNAQQMMRAALAWMLCRVSSAFLV